MYSIDNPYSGLPVRDVLRQIDRGLTEGTLIIGHSPVLPPPATPPARKVHAAPKGIGCNGGEWDRAKQLRL